MKYWFPYHIHTHSISLSLTHMHTLPTHLINLEPHCPCHSFCVQLNWFMCGDCTDSSLNSFFPQISHRADRYVYTLEDVFYFRKTQTGGTKVKQYSFLVNKRETLFTRTIYRVHVIHKPWCCPSTPNTLLLTLPSERFVTFHLSEQQMLPFTWRGRSIKIKEWLTFSVTTTTVIKSPLSEHINPAPSWTLPARENNRLTGLCVLVPGLLMTHSSG